MPCVWLYDQFQCLLKECNVSQQVIGHFDKDSQESNFPTFPAPLGFFGSYVLPKKKKEKRKKRRKKRKKKDKEIAPPTFCLLSTFKSCETECCGKCVRLTYIIYICMLLNIIRRKLKRQSYIEVTRLHKSPSPSQSVKLTPACVHKCVSVCECV
uniref:Uncharacterized protein n=1 Tax=Micrurus carvalhoi TaxID=3147026 RepID=A0A2H6NCK5_9SAUR